jgi:nucleoside-diphosphate-sugar epimerase
MAKLIVGCGYLGGRVARRWLAADETVYAVTRSAEHADALSQEGLHPIVADVTRPASLGQLPPAETVLYSVAYDPHSPATRDEVYAGGLRAVLGALPAATGRILLTSSTGVYGPASGDWVDENSPCRPTRDAGRAMLAAEAVLQSSRFSDRAIILRLAGLYGPGRIPRMADLLAGRPIAMVAQGYLNLIHVDDAAALIVAAASRARTPRIYVVADGQPVGRRDFYQHLAALVGLSAVAFTDPPPGDRSALRGGSDKRVRSARIFEELAVSLAYPSYKEGLAAMVAPSPSPSGRAEAR